MKMSISWHQEVLSNIKASLLQKEKYLAQVMKDVQDSKDRVLMYEQQIERAEKEGKDGFDRDKYGQKK